MATVRDQCDACSFDAGDTILERGELDKSILLYDTGQCSCVKLFEFGRNCLTYTTSAKENVQ